MKIKISEMFEHARMNADDLQIGEDPTIDKDRIRKIVLHKISPKKTSRRFALIAVAIVAMLAAAIGANAATGGKLFGAIVLNDENRHLAEMPDYASMTEASTAPSINDVNKRSLNSNIIREGQLQTLNAGSVTNIELEEKDSLFLIPQLLTGNGDLVIFTKEKGAGWELKKGDKLSIEFNLDLTTNSYSDPNGEYMELGLIHNGELIKGFHSKEKSFAYTVTADEDGVYYFYAENYSAGKIIVESGIVEQQ
ncbi:hypothetical protein [Cohnella sp.]|uniref:hypothetical protein n=1 Tax=Cohnella sp. TaxID=1883426 RepID=UPI003704D0AF